MTSTGHENLFKKLLLRIFANFLCFHRYMCCCCAVSPLPLLPHSTSHRICEHRLCFPFKSAFKKIQFFGIVCEIYASNFACNSERKKSL